VPGRRRGARTGRGWDAAPPRPRPARGRPPTPSGDHDEDAACAADAPLWTGEEEDYLPAGARDPRGTRNREETDDRPGTRSRGRAGDVGERRDRSDARDPAELAREICLQQLAIRPRTRAELAGVLRRRRIPDEVAAEVLDRYDEVGLIDDEAFARAWVSSRHHGRGLARRALAGELRQRGVDGELVGAALAELDPATEAATARELVERKLRGMGRAAPEAVFRRLIGMLARKGYPPGLAANVVKDALAQREADLATFADGVDPDALADLVGETGEAEGIDDPTR
jgi:regulatory protein